jgi:hypothetical protein
MGVMDKERAAIPEAPLQSVVFCFMRLTRLDTTDPKRTSNRRKEVIEE